MITKIKQLKLMWIGNQTALDQSPMLSFLICKIVILSALPNIMTEVRLKMAKVLKVNGNHIQVICKSKRMMVMVHLQKVE